MLGTVLVPSPSVAQRTSGRVLWSWRRRTRRGSYLRVRSLSGRAPVATPSWRRA